MHLKPKATIRGLFEPRIRGLFEPRIHYVQCVRPGPEEMIRRLSWNVPMKIDSMLALRRHNWTSLQLCKNTPSCDWDVAKPLNVSGACSLPCAKCKKNDGKLEKVITPASCYWLVIFGIYSLTFVVSNISPNLPRWLPFHQIK